MQMAPIRKICALVVRIEAPKKVRESGVAAAVTTPTASRSTAAITPSATAITVVHFLWRFPMAMSECQLVTTRVPPRARGLTW